MEIFIIVRFAQKKWDQWMKWACQRACVRHPHMLGNWDPIDLQDMIRAATERMLKVYPRLDGFWTSPGYWHLVWPLICKWPFEVLEGVMVEEAGDDEGFSEENVIATAPEMEVSFSENDADSVIGSDSEQEMEN